MTAYWSMQNSVAQELYCIIHQGQTPSRFFHICFFAFTKWIPLTWKFSFLVVGHNVCYEKLQSQRSNTLLCLHLLKQQGIASFAAKVGDDLLKIVKSTPVNFQQCPAFSMEHMLKLFLRMCIYYTIKFANQKFLSTSKKKSRKYIKVTHL